MNFPFNLIDLSHTLHDAIPTWNGGCGFNHDLHIDYSDCEGEDKFRVMKMSMHAGIGTHMDAPSHCFEGGRNIEEFKLNDLCMPCSVIDVSENAHELYSVTADDIEIFESKHGEIERGSCIMIKTGWEKYWTEPKKYHNNHAFPSVSEEASKLLLQREVEALGIDTLSPDRPSDGFNVHRTFLGSGKILVENVANLSQMPPTGSYVMLLPIKVKNGTEAPIRLVGLIDKNNST